MLQASDAVENLRYTGAFGGTQITISWSSAKSGTINGYGYTKFTSSAVHFLCIMSEKFY